MIFVIAFMFHWIKEKSPGWEMTRSFLLIGSVFIVVFQRKDETRIGVSLCAPGVHMCICTCVWRLLSVFGLFFPFPMPGAIPPRLCCLGHIPELCYNSNCNGFDSLLSIVQKAAVTEISKFCQQLSSEVMEAQARTGGVNRDEWGVMQSTKSLNSSNNLIFDGHDQ